ncbi:MAG: universal stress protein [Saprospiraceae bacterium]|nr:universal stress protein [Saprospiraceae bacterium]
MKILVPFDFSKTSDMALNYAIWHLQKFGGSIEVLHAISGIIATPEMPMILPDEMVLNGARERLSQVVEAKKKEFNLDNNAIESQVLVGTPASSILLKEKSTHYDLIVMGTHDKESLFDRILGSVSNTVIKLSSSPVLAVHSTSKADTEISKVLFVIDDVTHIDAALDRYLAYNNKIKAKTDFVHFSNGDDNIDKQAEEILKKYYTINDLQFAFELKNVFTKEPIEEISKMVAGGAYHMIAMVRDNEGLFFNYFRPSFSIKAVHNTILPALIFKAKET